MSSKLRKRIKSLNGLFFHEHENKKASNGPVDHFFLRSRNVQSAMTEWTVLTRAKKLESEA